VLDRAGYFRRWAALHGGYDPADSAPARGWLTLVYAAARRIVAVPPLAVTGAGVLAAVSVPLLSWAYAGPGGAGWLLAAAALAVLSGFLDSLDGAVAMLSGRAGPHGFVLDSVADRLADSAYAVAFWVLGAPGWLCVLGGGLAGLQEYVRARAGAAGMTEVGVVTVWERPTRVILTAGVLLATVAVGERFTAVPTAGALAWTVLGVVGLTQLSAVVRRRLG